MYYLIFGGRYFYAGGGVNDLIGVHANEAQARSSFAGLKRDELGDKCLYQWLQLVRINGDKNYEILAKVDAEED